MNTSDRNLNAISQIFKRTIDGNLTWGYDNNPKSNNIDKVFIAFLKYGFLRLTKKWNGDIILEILDTQHNKVYEFLRSPLLESLFNAVCPAVESQKINNILDNIIDGSAF